MAVHPASLEETTHLWEQVLAEVRNRLESPQAFETWFRPIVPLTLSPELVELEAPNSFLVDWIHEHYLSLLKHCVAETLGANVEVRLSTSSLRQEPLPPREPVRATEPAPVPTRVPVDGLLHPHHTFENFVVGSGNRFTHAACLAVAQNPGHVYNPLFIFGGSGLGKTHLLQAIGHAVRQARPAARVCYVSAERFTNEMIYAIQHAQTLAFRNKYRSVDLLLIDDIQFLAGKESTQEEFFHTFNALRDGHRQIVVSADKPPKDIPMLEERLTSRFNQGLVADVQQPELETRIAILRNRCAHEGNVRIPDDVLLLIADRIRNNIRDLEGCLVRIMAVTSLGAQEVTTALAEEVLQHYVNPEPDQLTPDRIVALVSEKFGARPEALYGQRRTRNIAMPRQVAMYLLRQLTDLSLAEIGRMFGGRDHTTVMYACDKIGSMIASDSVFSDKVNGMISTMASG